MADEPKLLPLNYYGPTPNGWKYQDFPGAGLWRLRRNLFRLGLFVVLAPIIFYFAKNLMMFHKLTPLTPADYVPLVQRLGVPTVRAMKQYQRDTGSLPDDLRALVPKYLAAEPPQCGPDYNYITIARGQLLIYPFGIQTIMYDFTPDTEGWSTSGPFVTGPIPLPPVTIGAGMQPTPAPQ